MNRLNRLIRTIQVFFGDFFGLEVILRTPKECQKSVMLEVGDRFTILTGKSKIDLRYKKGRILEVLLAPPPYVKRNWEGINDKM